MVLALILKLLKLQMLLKSCRAHFMYMRTLSFLSVTNHRCNKDVILNTKLLFVWSGPICYSLREKDGNSNKEWVTCAKTEKNMGTRLRNVAVLERTGTLTTVQATFKSYVYLVINHCDGYS